MLAGCFHPAATLPPPEFKKKSPNRHDLKFLVSADFSQIPLCDRAAGTLSGKLQLHSFGADHLRQNYNSTMIDMIVGDGHFFPAQNRPKSSGKNWEKGRKKERSREGRRGGSGGCLYRKLFSPPTH